MKNKILVEYLKELPGDYNVVLSKVVRVCTSETGEKEFFDVVTDDPIIGIVKNDNDKEIRFLLSSSDKEAIENTNNGNWVKI